MGRRYEERKATLKGNSDSRTHQRKCVNEKVMRAVPADKARQSKGDQIRPDQTRPYVTRSDLTRPHLLTY